MNNKNIFMVVKDFTTDLNTEKEVITIKGFANRYIDDSGNMVVDRSGDVVLPSSYNLTNYMKNPILLAYHNSSNPVGKIGGISLSQDGLEIIAEVHKILNPSVYYAVENQILTAFSIGFKATDYKYDEASDIFYYKSIELLEVSIVAVPDNQDSLFAVLTQSPCGDGSCLLSSKAITKTLAEFNSVVKNKNFSTDKWSLVDKPTLLENIKGLDNRDITKEAYLLQKEVGGKTTLKFPHHELKEGVLTVSKEGVASAYSALKSIMEEDKYSTEEKSQAMQHLRKHYEDMIEQNLLEELPNDFEEIEQKLVEMTKNENNDNSNTEQHEDEDTTQEVKETEEAEGTDNESSPVTYEQITQFVSDSTSEAQDLNNLLSLHEQIENKLNAILKI